MLGKEMDLAEVTLFLYSKIDTIQPAVGVC